MVNKHHLHHCSPLPQTPRAYPHMLHITISQYFSKIKKDPPSTLSPPSSSSSLMTWTKAKFGGTMIALHESST
ncbi:hypothetical protein IEQ34_002893 [Dendrobium chrysotoxum]|uniref:Uncharacterized protein n=1 Tax=Dendrobium chrysotoxum TaxID=161865 RepID=A0AAV7HIA9_DENCH|nr:hypothetical protein IEQ34_002893 [Dendrobium chrysotoxum]